MLSNLNQAPVVGSLLDGRYRIIKLLGQGGMGNVYLAEETRLRRRCALKLLHPQLAADRTHVERFLREAQTIAQFEHSNIVDIYAYGEEPSGLVWFAMELLNGEDLDARLKARSERPFSTHECCAWGVQVARAMAVVHQQGLVHRDLKTSNIFLAQRRDGEEVVKLLDFGIARPEEGSELTATGVSLGTPSYMSPEQVRNQPVDRRSDIYSFGVLLFKLITNRLPFTGEPIQVAMAHCNLPVPTPSDLAPDLDISPELDALVMRAMAKEPGKRYQSMPELEQALTEILQAEAPDLAPAAKPARMNTHSRSVGQSEARTRPATTVPTTVSPYVPSREAGTATMSLPATGRTATGPTLVTSASAEGETYKWMYITTGASILGIVIFVVVGAVFSAKHPPLATDPPRVVEAAPAIRPPRATPPEPPPSNPLRTPGSRPAQPAVAAPSPPEPLPAMAPANEPVSTHTASPPSSSPPPEKSKPKPVTVPRDPLDQINRSAQACRRKHGAIGGPSVIVDYAVGLDGKVTRAIPSQKDELGACLGRAVQETQFEPKLVLGKRLAL